MSSKDSFAKSKLGYDRRKIRREADKRKRSGWWMQS